MDIFFSKIDLLILNNFNIFIGFFLTFSLSYIIALIPNLLNFDVLSIRYPKLIFPLLGSVTYIAILAVKSSLSLSLGMVGALSIVRFRTPIKEPIELVLLFFCIAIAIGFAAGFIFISLSISLLIIFLLTFIFKRNYSPSHSHNIQNKSIIEISSKIISLPEVEKTLNSNNSNFIILSYSLIDNQTVVKLELNKQLATKEINQIFDEFKKQDSNIKILLLPPLIFT